MTILEPISFLVSRTFHLEFEKESELYTFILEIFVQNKYVIGKYPKRDDIVCNMGSNFILTICLYCLSRVFNFLWRDINK